MKKIFIKALLFCLPMLSIAITTGCNIGQSLYYSTDNVESKLEINKSKWQTSQPHMYQFKLSKSCFCEENDNKDIIVTVDNQQIVKVIDATTQEEIDLSQSDVTSIEALFQQISSELKRHAHQVDVKFNSEFGYPEQLWVDVQRQTPNDEYAISIYSLVALDELPK